MINYRSFDMTEKAHEIAVMHPTKRSVEDETYPFKIRERMPVPGSIDPFNEHGKFTIYAKEAHRLSFGNQVVDLTDLEQLIELSQTKALGFAMEYGKKYMDNKATLREVIQRVQKDIDEQGLDIVSDKISGHFASFRGLELAFALNRLRGFDVTQKKIVRSKPV